MQISLHHCEVASHNFLNTLRRLEVDIVLIQKPWSLMDRILGLSDPNYRLLVPKTSEKERTCILARLNLDLLITHFFYTGNVTTVAYRDDLGIDLMLSSVYMPYEPTSPHDDWWSIKEEKMSPCQILLFLIGLTFVALVTLQLLEIVLGRR